jgi:hypothetical protein
VGSMSWGGGKGLHTVVTVLKCNLHPTNCWAGRGYAEQEDQAQGTCGEKETIAWKAKSPLSVVFLERTWARDSQGFPMASCVVCFSECEE